MASHVPCHRCGGLGRVRFARDHGRCYLCRGRGTRKPQPEDAARAGTQLALPLRPAAPPYNAAGVARALAALGETT